MPVFVAFLRAVNVGGRTLKMADLREHLGALGYDDVETYIQTGNVRFATAMRSPRRVRERLEADIAALAGFDVTTMLRTPADLARVVTEAEGIEPRVSGDGVRRYVAFLAEPPAPEAIEQVESWDVPGEEARVLGDSVHWALAHPTAQAKLSNARLEKLLGPATTRDLKVVRSLAQMWGP